MHTWPVKTKARFSVLLEAITNNHETLKLNFSCYYVVQRKRVLLNITLNVYTITMKLRESSLDEATLYLKTIYCPRPSVFVGVSIYIVKTIMVIEKQVLFVYIVTIINNTRTWCLLRSARISVGNKSNTEFRFKKTKIIYVG